MADFIKNSWPFHFALLILLPFSAVLLRAFAQAAVVEELLSHRGCFYFIFVRLIRPIPLWCRDRRVV
jgi:hypothetical protein